MLNRSLPLGTLIMLFFTLMLGSCGGGDGVIPYTYEESEWHIGSTTIIFTEVGGGLIGPDLYIFFTNYDTLGELLIGNVVIDDIASVQIDTPTDCHIWFTLGTGFWDYWDYWDDEDNPCQVVFSQLEPKVDGKIKGSISGTLHDDEEKTYDTSTTFDAKIWSEQPAP